jgi:hypothetical protein
MPPRKATKNKAAEESNGAAEAHKRHKAENGAASAANTAAASSSSASTSTSSPADSRPADWPIADSNVPIDLAVRICVRVS